MEVLLGFCTGRYEGEWGRSLREKEAIEFTMGGRKCSGL